MSTDEFERRLTSALDRLALGFESADPSVRHEAKMVAKQNIGHIAREVSTDE